jgi:hypothetical protein
MNALVLERRIAFAIAVLTALSGIALVFAPPKLLALLTVLPPDTADLHLFAIVGMFMAVVGGLLGHALHRPLALPTVLPWSTLQKFLAAVFVAWGIWRGVLGPLGWPIAAIDFATALLFLDLRRRLASTRPTR